MVYLGTIEERKDVPESQALREWINTLPPEARARLLGTFYGSACCCSDCSANAFRTLRTFGEYPACTVRELRETVLAMRVERETSRRETTPIDTFREMVRVCVSTLSTNTLEGYPRGTLCECRTCLAQRFAHLDIEPVLPEGSEYQSEYIYRDAIRRECIVRNIAMAPGSEAPVAPATSPRSTSLSSTQWSFGAEIEVIDIGPDESIVPNGWGAKEDGSLQGDSSAEFVTRPLVTAEGIREFIKGITSIARAGASVNKSCGFHVHIGAPQDVDIPAWALKLRRLVQYSEQIILGAVPPSRRGNRFCSPLHSRDRVAGLQIRPDGEIREPISGRRVTRYRVTDGGDRYQGLNLHSLNCHGTVEFRYAPGTVSAGRGAAWIIFCTSLAQYARMKNVAPVTRRLVRSDPDCKSFLRSLLPSATEVWGSNAERALECIRERFRVYELDGEEATARTAEANLVSSLREGSVTI